MSSLTQFYCPLKPGKLMFYRMTGTEELSRPFEYELELLSVDGGISFSELLGQPAYVKTRLSELGDAEGRFFHGHVTEFGLVGRLGRYFRYRAVLRPWLWFLSKVVDCRIFQEKTVIDIVKAVFDGHEAIAKVEFEASEPRDPIPYCVQYRESDFNFVCRLLEQHGLRFMFKHTRDGHIMIISDAQGQVQHQIEGYESIPYMMQTDSVREDLESIQEWRSNDSVFSWGFATTDYDYLRPRVDLSRARDLGEGDHRYGSYEVFDYPGGFSSGIPDQHPFNRQLEQVADSLSTEGVTRARGIACGYYFTLTGHPNSEQNKDHYVCKTHITLVEPDYEAIRGDGVSLDEPLFQCRFSVDGYELKRNDALARPRMYGPQTAVVVDAEQGTDDDIHTDQYGRVRVRFFWDRYFSTVRAPRGGGEHLSAYLRVATLWAGKNYGFIALPRTGQEVIVDFLEGDPDQPIITGRVYNAEQMPPWTLPEHKTRSGVVTRTLQGNWTTANELRFEDKPAEEQVFLHAERNLDVEVEKRETRKVGTNQYISVGGDSQSSIGGNRSASVGKNDSTTITADRKTMVGGDQKNSVNGDATFVAMGSYKAAALSMDIKSETLYKLAAIVIDCVATAAYSIKTTSYKLAAPAIEVSGTQISQTATGIQKIVGGATLNLGSQAIVNIEAPIINLKAGPSSISLTPAGITISGPMVSVTGAATVTITGAIIKNNC
jgi:type VI secretion system secreted protein VgrG